MRANLAYWFRLRIVWQRKNLKHELLRKLKSAVVTLKENMSLLRVEEFITVSFKNKSREKGTHQESGSVEKCLPKEIEKTASLDVFA
jgi:hypothetical protein